MAVDRPVVADAEIIENHAWRDEAFQSGLCLVNEFACGFSADPLHEACSVFVKVYIRWVGDEAVQVIRNRTHVFGNRPFVVIENNDEPLGCGGDIVQGFKTDAAGEGCIARHADDMLVGADLVAGCSHAKRGGERCSRVACPVAIVLAFASKKEAVQPLVLTNRWKAVESPGHELMDIALVADIENELVLGRIEDAVKGNRQFDDPEVGAQMATCLR